ncbi:MAG: hypothetical protein M3R55_07750 [Acidobacteriota bacterium]|nr:hypothetical protein [Acidobacteriota bacterium]
MTPTVFLAVRGGFTPRFLLRTDILPTLRAKGVRVVILSPNADETYFRKEFEAEDVFVEKLEVARLEAYAASRPGQRVLRTLRLQISSGRADLTTIEQMAAINEDTARKRGLRGFVTSRALRVMTQLARRSRLVREIITRSESALFTPTFHGPLYNKYRPQAVVVTSLGFSGSEPDNYLMREARHFGAKVIASVLSWDNTSSKGLRGGPVDHAIAWTDVMKEELKAYHDIPADRITVCGPPHFDAYYRPGGWSRDEMFTRLGLDPARKLLTFATKSPTNYPWNEEIAEMIGRAVADGRIVEPCQLLVRLHPIYYRQRDGQYKFQPFLERARDLARRYRCITIDEPQIVSRTLALDMPHDEMNKVLAILKHSSVFLNIYSTMNLEAAIVDTPCVNISFNGTEGSPDLRKNVALDEVQPHNQRVVQSGGVAMVRSEAEMIDAINAYLRDPGLHREGRRRIRERECGRYPGTAGVAVGETIARLVA